MILALVLNTWEGQTLAIIISGVVLAFPVALWRWGKRHVAEPLQAVPVIVAKQDEVAQDIADMKKELYPNGGASLRDSIIRNEDMTGTLVKQIDALNDAVCDHIDQDETRFDSIDVQLRGAAHTAENVHTELHGS